MMSENPPDCRCGANPPHPYNETVIFRREGMFYPIVGTVCEDWAHHASLNPGTLAIEKPDGTQVWSEVAEHNEKLRADLAKYADAWTGCEACGAPLFDDDDFVSDDCSGCWAAMTDAPDEEKRKHPCYAYRVGKADARLPVRRGIEIERERQS